MKKAQFPATLTWFTAFLAIFFILVFFLIFAIVSSNTKSGNSLSPIVQAKLSIENGVNRDSIITNQLISFLNTPVEVEDNGNKKQVDVYYLIKESEILLYLRNIVEKKSKGTYPSKYVLESDPEYQKSESYAKVFNETAEGIFSKIYPNFVWQSSAALYGVEPEMMFWWLFVQDKGTNRFQLLAREDSKGFYAGFQRMGCGKINQAIYSDVLIDGEKSLFSCFAKNRYDSYFKYQGYEIQEEGK